MIGQALQLVVDRLNVHLRAQFSVSEDLVSLSPLADADGKPTETTRNRLAIFLTGIQQDRIPRRLGSRSQKRASDQPAPYNLDVYFMLASGHEPRIYAEGLKLLAASLFYFQQRPLWTHSNTSEMSAGIHQLTFEISNLPIQDSSHLWGNLGGGYVPSVMFKMRSIHIDAETIATLPPEITSLSETVGTPEGLKEREENAEKKKKELAQAGET